MSKFLFAAVAAIALGAFAFAEDKKDDKKAEVLVKIVHVETGKVLAVEDDSDESEKPIVLAKDEVKAERQWKIVTDGEWLKIVHAKSGKVLDVNNASSDEGAQLIIWDAKDDDNDNQRFQWVGKGEEKRLKAKGSSLVLDLEKTNVVQKKSDEKSKSQTWKVVEVKK